MTKTFSFTLIGLLLLGPVEYSIGQVISNQQKAKIEEQVDSVFHDHIKSAEHLDFDRLSLGVDDKYHAGFILNGIYYAKYDSLINIVKMRSQSISSQVITIQTKKVTVLSDCIVLVTAYGEAKADVSDGNTLTSKFFWSFVFEKIGNDWKVIQSHQSNIR